MDKTSIVLFVIPIGKIHVKGSNVHSSRKIRTFADDVICLIFIKIFKSKQTNAEELKTVKKCR